MREVDAWLSRLENPKVGSRISSVSIYFEIEIKKIEKRQNKILDGLTCWLRALRATSKALRACPSIFPQPSKP
jgi:hypothetical protein